VTYNERAAEYLDNVPATLRLADSDLGFTYADTAAKVPPTASSSTLRHCGQNDSIRSPTWQCAQNPRYRSGDWSANFTRTGHPKNLEAEGVFAESGGEVARASHNPTSTAQLYNALLRTRIDSRTRAHLTAVSVPLKRSPTRLLFRSHVEQGFRLHQLRRALYVDYYQCEIQTPPNPATSACFHPSSTWHDLQRNTHQSHESARYLPR